jgi:Ca2+-binding RTX toxin-like protein
MAVFIGSDTADDSHVGTEEIQYGLGGDDFLLPSAVLAVTLYGGDGNDDLNGRLQDDELYGERGNDILAGGGGRDLLAGGSGDDTLSAEGDDTLYGGTGHDAFEFAAPYTDTGTSRIQDFDRTQDSLVFATYSFPGLKSGATLDPDNFYKGKTALEGDDHLGYDKDSGKLYYDINGNDAGGRQLVAILDKGTKLKAGDIDLLTGLG